MLRQIRKTTKDPPFRCVFNCTSLHSQSSGILTSRLVNSLLILTSRLVNNPLILTSCLVNNLCWHHVLQSDEDEDNYDEVRYRIEQSIIKERLTRLAAYGSSETSPLGDDAATEEQGAAKGSINCEAIHKRFNINSCYLCKNATAKDKRVEKKKSNLDSDLCIPVLSVFNTFFLCNDRWNSYRKLSLMGPSAYKPPPPAIGSSTCGQNITSDYKPLRI